MNYSVYKVVNEVNDKLYVGYTGDSLENRWLAHKQTAHNRVAAHRPLYVAIREHGIEQFRIELIETCSDRLTVLSRESYWIRHLRSTEPHGYNQRARPLSDEQVAIIRYGGYTLTQHRYALLFGVPLSYIGPAQTGRGGNYTSDPYAYITRSHLPENVEAYMQQLFDKANSKTWLAIYGEVTCRI